MEITLNRAASIVMKFTASKYGEFYETATVSTHLFDYLTAATRFHHLQM